MTKGDLKELIKECILEVIADGVRGDRSYSTSVVREAQQRAAPARVPPPARKVIGNTILDRPAIPQRATPQPQPDRIARSLTSDPTLQSIFADTAATTLQEQLSAERAGPVLTGGDAASAYVAKSDPVDLFGQAASNWAALAFADDVKR